MRSKKFRPFDVVSIGSASIEPCERRMLMSTYTVNTLSDAIAPVTGQLTLRQAVADTNAHFGDDTINFDPNVFVSGSVHSIVLINGPIVFTDNTGITVLTGPASATLAVDGNGASRDMQISSGARVFISALTIANGSVNSSAGMLAAGGGVLNDGTLTLRNVTVSNNNVIGGSAETLADQNNIGGDAEGGGIYSSGSLTLDNSLITDNTAQGGAHSYGLGLGGEADGGGIYSIGSLAVTDSELSANSALGGDATGLGGAGYGGSIYSLGTFPISETSVTTSKAQGGAGIEGTGGGGNASGGGIFVNGTANLSSVEIQNNTALGGNAAFGGFPEPGGVVFGGGVFSENSLTISTSLVSGNTAHGGQADLADNGSGGNAYGGGIAATGMLAVTSTTVSSNGATAGEGAALLNTLEALASGGGIYSMSSLTLSGSTISGNTAQGAGGDDGYGGTGGTGEGGAVSVALHGMATISSSSVADNKALGGEGDPEQNGFGGPFGPGGSGLGGGIFNQGTLGVSFSTVSGNVAAGGSSSSRNQYGATAEGGGGQGGAIDSNGNLSLTDDTLTANSATGGAAGTADAANGSNGGYAFGGAINSLAQLIIADSTLTGNQTVGGAGGGVIDAQPGTFPNGSAGQSDGGAIEGSVTVTNTIISGDKSDGSFNDISSTLPTNSGYNLIGVGGGLTNGVNGNKVGINNPLLEPLGNYGGPTETMVPLPSSPAVNAGSNALIPAGVTTDQRGYSRIVGPSVDIGADELNNALISGVVYNDANGDGIQESAEGGLGGQVVYDDLTNSGYYQSADPSTTTNSSGQYTLNGLPEGTAIIRVKIPSADRQSYPAGTSAHAVTIGPAAVTGQNFGLSTKLYISGKITFNGVGQGNMLVYADLNNDGKFESNENNKLTGSDGTFAFVSLIAGTYTFRVAPLAGEIQTSPANNAGITVTLGSGGVDSNVNFTFASATISKFAGTAIGTPGSYRNHGTTIADAFDQNFNTFFDAPDASGDWVGLDLGSAKIVTQVKFAPRAGYEYRMDGGEIQASNSANFSSGVVTLYTISSTPAAGVLTAEHLSNTTAYRYYRYLGPANSYCDIAELEFDG